MNQKKHNDRKELKFINYRKYIITLAILAICAILINVMYRVSTVFAHTYCTTAFTYLMHVIGGINGHLP